MCVFYRERERDKMTPLLKIKRPWVVLGTDLWLTSSKCQRYVPQQDLGFDATPPRGAMRQRKPLLSLKPRERQQVVVCEFPSDNLVVTSRITLQPPLPTVCVCWQRSSGLLEKGKESSMVSLQGLEFVIRAQEYGTGAFSCSRGDAQTWL